MWKRVALSSLLWKDELPKVLDIYQNLDISAYPPNCIKDLKNIGCKTLGTEIVRIVVDSEMLEVFKAYILEDKHSLMSHQKF